MKALPKINRIVYAKCEAGRYFALWRNGRREWTMLEDA